LAFFEVKDVAFAPEVRERLAGFELDVPKTGTKRNAYVLHLIGWAVGRDVRPAAIEVRWRGQVIRTVPIRGTRADVAAAMGLPEGTDCVFHSLVNLIGLGLDVTLDLRVVLEDGTAFPATSLTVPREPLRTEYEPHLAPLIVSTLGRSGSTFLMQLLASHPQVVAFRRFPYESAPAKYWLHMVRVVAEPANFVESARAETFHRDPWWIGNNPYHDDRVFEQPILEDWFARNHVERLAAFSQRTIDDWYLTLARTQLQDAPVYFAEKHVWPNYLPAFASELYPNSKEVFLVRDFRDMAQSIIAFDAKRGFAGFGRPAGISDEDYLRDGLRQMALDLRDSWLARGKRGHLVRYEDLILDPRRTVTGMLEYLELDASPDTVQELLSVGSEEVLRLPGAAYEVSEIRAHRTIPDPKATIGRWRADADNEFRELSDELFREALDVFGYT
jgi:Sulfotransferase family